MSLTYACLKAINFALGICVLAFGMYHFLDLKKKKKKKKKKKLSIHLPPNFPSDKTKTHTLGICAGSWHTPEGKVV